MRIALLHLSDIHIHDSSCPVLQRVEAICSTVNPVLPSAAAVLIIVTGDIAYSGTKEQYVLAEHFLTALADCIRRKTDSTATVNIFTVPGNHDGMFKESSAARRALIASTRNGGAIDASVIEIVAEPQRHYFEFEERICSATRTFADRLWKQHLIEIGSTKVALSAINASWMSEVPEEPGRLVFPVSNYAEIARVPADLRIAILHHPLNWYCQTTYHPLRELCRSQFEIVMSGHEHSSSAARVHDLEHGELLMLEAGALWPHHGQAESHFDVITLDLSTKLFARATFSWDGQRYIDPTGSAVWDTFVPLPKRKKENFIVEDEFRKKLDDVGATFTHPNRGKLVLADIFIYPELTKLDAEDDEPEVISSKVLVTQMASLGRAILRGDEQFGKTSLLHTLYQNYLDAGLVPLLLKGKDLTNADSESQLGRRILRAVEEQYGKAAVPVFEQVEKEGKIILVDDLDSGSTHPDALARALEYIAREYEYALVTVSDKFDLAEATSKKTLNAAQDFASYKFNGFGYKLRGELIAQWVSIGQTFKPEEAQRLIHSSEQTINTIIGKGLVPTTAFNTIVLLQSMEANSKGGLANAGMAQYYEFLIRRSLFNAKLKVEHFDEIFSYISHLAWFFTTRATKSIDISDLKDFNKEFSDKIQDTDFLTRIEFLVRCRILEVMGSTYSFRYPYIRYFFAAKYISDHVEEQPELKLIVIRACQHLYLRENGNIILFLTHHAPNKWIIREIANTLIGLMSTVQPLNIKEDTKLLNGWVTQTAKLFVDTTDIKKNQEQHRESADKSAAAEDAEPRKEVTSASELDVMAQVQLLFKTCEILGQILKNRYGSLDKTFKHELMKQLFDGPLRGINYFLELINDDPDALLKELTSKFLERAPNIGKERAIKTAQRLLVTMLGTIAEQFISRQGEIMGAPMLKSTADEVVKSSSNLTHRIVAVSAQLSYPGDPPFAAVEALAKELEENVFGYRLLQGIVSRHLYMFSLPYDQRQRLAEAADVGIQTQSSIAFKSADSKKVRGRSFRPQHTQNLFGKLQSSYLKRHESITARVLGKPQKK